MKFSHSETIGAFRDAIIMNLGTAPKEIIADGALHRFPTKAGNDTAGWYKLHLDGIPAGAFGDWRRNDASFKWSARGSEPLPQKERDRLEEEIRQREAERERKAEEAAENARQMWQDAGLGASASHAYLAKKQIGPNGARELNGELLIPITDGERILNLQRIAPSGEKRFLLGGRVTGLYYTLGAPGERIVVCEGFATGASIFEATGLCIAIAFNAGNLGPAARAIREHHRNARIVIAADDDFKTDGNPGLTKAREAAEKVGASVAVPPFNRGDGDDGTDWNDFAIKRGKAAVKQAFEVGDKATAGGREWLEPKPLPCGLLPVMPFALDYLPESISAWVGDISDRMQCPPDFVGIAAIVALGSALGRKVGIRPQAQTDWTEVPNLWACIVGRPGAMKSPAMQEALKPLHRLEANARKDHEEQLKEYEANVALHKIGKDIQAARARDALKKGLSTDGILLCGEPEEPKARRFVTNDTTYEKLGEILADNPDGVLAYRDELISLLKTLDREEYAGARGFYLTAWGGTQGYAFDRVTRGKTHIEAACVSMLGSTQPGRLAEYIGRATTGGSGDDGMIQRFSLLAWPDQSPAWRDEDRYPLTEPRRRAYETFGSFGSYDPCAFGATQEEEGLPYFRFAPAALDAFREWRADLEKRLRSGELSPALESHLSKFRKTVPALALINHVSDGGRDAIGETAVLRALAFAEYLESHARRAYAAGGETETTAATAILKRIRSGDLKDGFTTRELWRNKWSGLTDLEHVKAGVWLLADLNYLAPTKKDGTGGGRPTTTFTVNPRALA
ncbi:DUF3987 domain-containing protein [Methylocystis sp. IM3]|uniref:DUF3987 domain-containing protein n=1 Tax=unclassified Methylocystis TaxID=2625913 RepID=UPI0030F5E5E3